MNAESKSSRAWLVVIFTGLAVAIAGIALAVWIFLGIASYVIASPAHAQHVHPDETITDPHVAKFYETWTRPPQRTVSCCNMKDCYSAKIRRGPNGLEYLHKWSGKWAPLPASIIESNHADPRESPNTENHVCANEMFPDVVYCAVLASGT
jgi:hypothetical protein